MDYLASGRFALKTLPSRWEARASIELAWKTRWRYFPSSLRAVPKGM
jgi:hypothetical protein